MDGVNLGITILLKSKKINLASMFQVASGAIYHQGNIKCSNELLHLKYKSSVQKQYLYTNLLRNIYLPEP